ncbi:SPW repeat protein [Paracoccus versutus]
MLKSLSLDRRTAFDIANVVAGLGLLLSPWYLGFAAETAAAGNAWLIGAAMTLIALAAHRLEEWANAALGLWAVIAPWVLGFATLAAAMWVHVIAGLIVAILAGFSLWSGDDRPYSTA